MTLDDGQCTVVDEMEWHSLERARLLAVIAFCKKVIWPDLQEQCVPLCWMNVTECDMKGARVNHKEPPMSSHEEFKRLRLFSTPHTHKRQERFCTTAGVTVLAPRAKPQHFCLCVFTGMDVEPRHPSLFVLGVMRGRRTWSTHSSVRS